MVVEHHSLCSEAGCRAVCDCAAGEYQEVFITLEPLAGIALLFWQSVSRVYIQMSQSLLQLHLPVHLKSHVVFIVEIQVCSHRVHWKCLG